MTSQIELEEQALEEQYNNGGLTLKQYNREMQELQRDYHAEAEESAQNAYREELERW